jgi:hypothetical protein
LTDAFHVDVRKGCSALSGSQITQDVVQDTAVLEVFEFIERIYPTPDRNLFGRTIGKRDLGSQGLKRRKIGKAANHYNLVTFEAERLPTRALIKNERQHAHADQVRSVNALKRLRDYGSNAQQFRAFCRPVA